MSPLAKVVGKTLKALYSGMMSMIGILSVTLSGTQTFTDLTTQQWLLASGVTLGAIGGTYGLAGWSGPTSLSSRNGRHGG